jgi:hypothetical protein
VPSSSSKQYLTAESRLRHTKFRRRLCESALGRNADEVAKLFGVHGAAAAISKWYISRSKSGLAIAAAT